MKRAGSFLLDIVMVQRINKAQAPVEPLAVYFLYEHVPNRRNLINTNLRLCLKSKNLALDIFKRVRVLKMLFDVKYIHRKALFGSNPERVVNFYE